MKCYIMAFRRAAVFHNTRRRVLKYFQKNLNLKKMKKYDLSGLKTQIADLNILTRKEMKNLGNADEKLIKKIFSQLDTVFETDVLEKEKASNLYNQLSKKMQVIKYKGEPSSFYGSLLKAATPFLVFCFVIIVGYVFVPADFYSRNNAVEVEVEFKFRTFRGVITTIDKSAGIVYISGVPYKADGAIIYTAETQWNAGEKWVMVKINIATKEIIQMWGKIDMTGN